MARKKSKEEIGEQTLRLLVANNEHAINRRNRIMRANIKLLTPIYKREGNKKAVRFLRSELGLFAG